MRLAACHGKQSRHARGQGARAHAFQALGDQAAVVGVQPHHVSHGAQSHQRQQAIHLGLAFGIEYTPVAHLGPQGQQHVEHHTHPGDCFAFKRATGLVGVDDDAIGGQHRFAVCLCGQVVVGHQHLQPQGTCGCHTVDAGNAVVDRDQHLSTTGGNPLRDAGCQAVAIGHTVGHQVADEPWLRSLMPVRGQSGLQHAQPTQSHGACGGTVAVVIGHHADAQVVLQCIGQQHGGRIGVFQGGGGKQAGQAVVQLIGAGHAACRIQACQQGVYASLFQCPDGTGRDIAVCNFHSEVMLSNERWVPKKLEMCCVTRCQAGVGDRHRCNQPCSPHR